jgi:hypothetical protein
MGRRVGCAAGRHGDRPPRRSLHGPFFRGRTCDVQGICFDVVLVSTRDDLAVLLPMMF